MTRCNEATERARDAWKRLAMSGRVTRWLRHDALRGTATMPLLPRSGGIERRTARFALSKGSLRGMGGDYLSAVHRLPRTL